jgi:hypothetical protein
VPQDPVSSHVCTLVPEHCVVPGVQEPVQEPLPHDCDGQDEGAAQVPFGPQVCTP